MSQNKCHQKLIVKHGLYGSFSQDAYALYLCYTVLRTRCTQWESHWQLHFKILILSNFLFYIWQNQNQNQKTQTNLTLVHFIQLVVLTVCVYTKPIHASVCGGGGRRAPWH